MTFAHKKLVLDGITPVAAYDALRRAAPGASFLFESVTGGERWGRRTVVGYRPRFEATLDHDGWRIRDDQSRRFVPMQGDPMRGAAEVFALGQAREASGATDRSSLAQARFGYFAWDLVAELTKVEPHASLPGPLARFMGDCTLVVFDNLEQTATISGPSEDDVRRAISDLSSTPRSWTPMERPDRSCVPADVLASVSDESYAALVRRAKEYILAGDVFQVVLSRSFLVPDHGTDPFEVYRALRIANPSPYMYFLDLPAADGAGERTQILGASPETVARLRDGVVTIRPIAGTRPRGATPEEDLRMEHELVNDPKERAEHVMLIDLGRNDVGRIAEVGSVRLVDRMIVERYSHVMHMTSEVQGRVPAEISPLEVLRAAFPAGTLSGAPKVRAMQIIRELERGPRWLYGGAVGYLTPRGDFDFAIAIRTAVHRGGNYEVRAGAGIVEASVPEAEAAETLAKARGVLCAIEAARRRSP